MMDDVIKLIDLSIEDGRISDEDFQVILKKALNTGMDEDEVRLIISKRIKQKSIEKEASIQLPGLPASENVSNISVLPYLLAAIAVGSSFLKWVGVSSSSSFGGYSGGMDISVSAWWGGYGGGGYGASILLIYAVGCFLYYKRINYYWLAGIFSIIDAIIIYSALSEANVSANYDFGEYGSGSVSSGYSLRFGFYIFLIASAFFSLTGLVLIQRQKSVTGVKRESRFKRNFRSGKVPLLLAGIVSILIGIFIYFQQEYLAGDSSDWGAAIFISFAINFIYFLLLLILFSFSSSSIMSSYILLSFITILIIAFAVTAGVDKNFYFSSLYAGAFPLLNMIFNLIFSNGKTSATLKESSNIIVFIAFTGALLMSCDSKVRSESYQADQLSGKYVFEGVDVKYIINVSDGAFSGYAEDNFGSELVSFNGSIAGKTLKFDDDFDESSVKLTGRISGGRIDMTMDTYGVISESPIEVTLYKE